MLIGPSFSGIVSNVDRLLHDAVAYERMSSVQSPFGDGKAAERIVSVLAETFAHRVPAEMAVA